MSISRRLFVGSAVAAVLPTARPVFKNPASDYGGIPFGQTYALFSKGTPTGRLSQAVPEKQTISFQQHESRVYRRGHNMPQHVWFKDFTQLELRIVSYHQG